MFNAIATGTYRNPADMTMVTDNAEESQLDEEISEGPVVKHFIPPTYGSNEG